MAGESKNTITEIEVQIYFYLHKGKIQWDSGHWSKTLLVIQSMFGRFYGKS